MEHREDVLRRKKVTLKAVLLIIIVLIAINLWTSDKFQLVQRGLAVAPIYYYGPIDKNVGNRSQIAVDEIKETPTAVVDPEAAFYNALNLEQVLNMSSQERDNFMAFKESLYVKRHKRIRKMCRLFESVYWTKKNSRMHKIRPDSVAYDSIHNVSYCFIPKAASSTWSRNFIDLAKPTQKQLNAYRRALQILLVKSWPLPNQRDSQQSVKLLSAKDMTSLAIVRHPFSRLASVYQQKFLDLGQTAWAEGTKLIIGKFRTEQRFRADAKVKKGTEFKYLGDNPDYASPDEFLQQVAFSLSEDRADQHWRPQHGECPFCRVNFTVMAKVEELSSDEAYFWIKSGLKGDSKQNSSSISSSRRINKSKNDEYQFWSRIPVETLRKILFYYALDFDMFDYSAESYFKDLSLTELEEEVNSYKAGSSTMLRVDSILRK